MTTEGTIIDEDGFGVIPIITDDNRNFEIVKRYTLTNKTKASVTLITWGAGIQGIRVPNYRGILGDVVLGFDDIDGYWNNRHVGRILGRVTRRVSTDISPSLSHDPLVSGINNKSPGFDSVNWDSYILGEQVVMSHLSRNDRFHPGEVLTQVKYSWSDNNELFMDLRASCTRPTPVDITSFCLFNLAGHGMGSEELNKHVVSINASKWLHSDVRTKLPSGAVRSVRKTKFDLRTPTELNLKRLESIPGGGYDHFFCVNSPSTLCYRFHARVLHPDSGRVLEVNSNQAGLHFYTANEFPRLQEDLHYWDRSESPCRRDKNNNSRGKSSGIPAKGGVMYKRHSGFSISPRNYPDSVNFNHFPSNILYPGHDYHYAMALKFGIKKSIPE
ncbi:aldose 1-epimerase-like [Fopius arisanus]|uniref:Galactose mutarotase n=1 Tax=Fopius arisanus TaxID=64838 RepID=A0A9R1T756_9HYME|nr:PREDICTED: aldose 1-epimerase-like [Fopius arisanus]XP_011304105.1 PREDICTED: aldose 1-epimerase-like [Fopius arisanus]